MNFKDIGLKCGLQHMSTNKINISSKNKRKSKKMRIKPIFDQCYK